jgi:hypothetical protein
MSTSCWPSANTCPYHTWPVTEGNWIHSF